MSFIDNAWVAAWGDESVAAATYHLLRVVQVVCEDTFLKSENKKNFKKQFITQQNHMFLQIYLNKAWP